MPFGNQLRGFKQMAFFYYKFVCQFHRGTGGSERIRTAVRGFADLCLATRPRNQFGLAAALAGS